MIAFREIHTRVVSVLVKALGVDEDDVTPSATLQGDLGAESIDFLDIVFRLERAFAITIPRGELFSERVFELSAKFMQDGKIVAASVEQHRLGDFEFQSTSGQSRIGQSPANGLREVALLELAG